jgi:ribosome-binding factor A
VEGGRQQRVADQIQKELASFIQFELKDPRLKMITVSGVEVSRDFSYADVYVTFMGVNADDEAKELLLVLNRASGYLRKLLGQAIKLRLTPSLRFHYDKTLVRGMQLNSLISKAIEEDKHQQDLAYDNSDPSQTSDKPL